MRTQIIVALSAVLLGGAAGAADKSHQKAVQGPGRYGQAGCGLGSLAFGSEPGGVQILAATTNEWVTYNQTFAMSSGTSNCAPALTAQGTRNFVDANREALAKDASRGEGDAVGAISWINGCKDARAVGATLQRNFSRIFPSEQASNEDVTRALLDTLHADEALGCAKG